MAAYIIARVEVEDVSLLKDYLVATPPIVKIFYFSFSERLNQPLYARYKKNIGGY